MMNSENKKPNGLELLSLRAVPEYHRLSEPDITQHVHSTSISRGCNKVQRFAHLVVSGSKKRKHIII